MTGPFGSAPAYAILILGLSAVTFFGGCNRNEKTKAPGRAPGERRFLVLDPGHFHAALVFRPSAYENISSTVGVYAPVGDDVLGFRNLVTPFNSRKEDPGCVDADS